MKKLKILLLALILLRLSEQIFAQTEYKIIEIPQKPSIPLKFQTNQIIQQYLNYYQGRGRVTMKTILARSGRHEKMIQRIFREESVPENLSWMQQIEEIWWNYPARSWDYVKPLWVFQPDIAPKYGLRKTKFLNETKGFEKATHATAQYLKYLFNKYAKNWELTLAAYFAGKNAVNRAIKKAKVKDFWQIYEHLSPETRVFVPHVLATILIANNPESYGFTDVKKDLPIEYELVRIPPSVSLERIAEYSGTDINFIKQINPELISNLTPPQPYIVRVPMGSGQIFAQRMRSLLSR